MEGILRKRITIDDKTGKPIKEIKILSSLFTKNTKRKDIIEFFKEIGEVINEMDD